VDQDAKRDGVGTRDDLLSAPAGPGDEMLLRKVGRAAHNERRCDQQAASISYYIRRLSPATKVSYLHTPQVCVEPADVDVQPVVGVLRKAPLLVRHAEHEVDAAVDLVLKRAKGAII